MYCSEIFFRFCSYNLQLTCSGTWPAVIANWILRDRERVEINNNNNNTQKQCGSFWFTLIYLAFINWTNKESEHCCTLCPTVSHHQQSSQNSSLQSSYTHFNLQFADSSLTTPNICIIHTSTLQWLCPWPAVRRLEFEFECDVNYSPIHIPPGRGHPTWPRMDRFGPIKGRRWKPAILTTQ